MSLHDNKQVVLQMWDCLYSKAWDKLSKQLADDCWFEDVPAPDTGARGPKNIIDRLRIGFDHIERFEHDVRQVVAEGNHVFVEHTERWYFRTGETVENHLVSVHEVREGKILLWRDYWDISTMISQAPQWWIEKVSNESPQDFT